MPVDDILVDMVHHDPNTVRQRGLHAGSALPQLVYQWPSARLSYVFKCCLFITRTASRLNARNDPCGLALDVTAENNVLTDALNEFAG